MRMRLLASCALLAPMLAHAQGTILQGGPVTAGHVPMYLQAGSSQPTIMDSGAAAGGAVGYGLNELLLAVRGHGTAPYANAGTGPLGTNICDYDAPITNATGYHWLCLSPNAQGGGLIAYGASGSATPLPLQISVNGTLYPFPGGGSGSITGPASSTINDLALWNNITGTVLKDAANSQAAMPYAFPSSFGSTPTDVFSVNVGNYPASSEIPAATVQGIVGKVVIPGTYSGEPWPNAAVSGYALSSNVASQNSHLAFFGFAGAQANGANAYGGNVVVTNCATVVCTANNGFDGSQTGFEIDVNNVTKSGAQQPSGGIRGLEFSGGSNGLPTVGATAISIDTIGPSLAWSNGLLTNDNATVVAINIGALTAGNSQPSQDILLHSRTAGGATNIGILTTDLNGKFDFSSNQSLPSLKIYGSTEGDIISTSANNLILNAANAGASVAVGGTTVENSSFQASPVVSSVDFIHVFGATTGNSPRMECDGTDTNIPCTFASKGSLPVYLATEQGGALQVAVQDVASPANQLALGGGTNPFVSTTGGNLLVTSNSGVITVTGQENISSTLSVAGLSTLAGTASGGTTFTIASGCGSVGSLTGGAATGSFTAGQTACTPVINLPTAPHGWWCSAHDITNPSDLFSQTAKSTTSCTMSATVSSSDVIVFHAEAY